MAGPDFWLIECDTFWHDLDVDRVACYVVDGPREFIDGYATSQWLVRVEPAVRDHDTTTDRVLVDVHPVDRQDGDDWTLFCTGVYSVNPSDLSRVGGHKMTATTTPDAWLPDGRKGDGA